jgi:hypothetical protein
MVGLTGTAPLADYIQVLRTIAYENAAASPAYGTRTIRFVADDGSQQSPVAELALDVRFIDVSPSDISLSASTVAENSAADAVVGDLSTIDPNATDTFVYSFVAPDSDAGGRFKIVGNQIQVANGSLLDYESATSHDVTVRTTDSGGLTFDKPFTIDLTDVNEAPTDIALSSSHVPEHSPDDTVVGDLSSADQDAGESFSYSFVAPNGDAGGRFKIAGNQVEVADGSQLDYDTAASHAVTVRTTDGGGLSFDKSFSIVVDRVNAPPKDNLL